MSSSVFIPFNDNMLGELVNSLELVNARMSEAKLLRDENVEFFDVSKVMVDDFFEYFYEDV